MFYFLIVDNFFFWIFLFLGFSVKVPILPFHIWLPEAHVEAPTPGSVILAGILLKLGTYGILRFLVGSFFIVVLNLFPFLFSISFFGLFYPSIIALTQMDIKKVIAYSSISHMNFSLIGFFSNFFLGLMGSFFMMFGHSITSSALFFGIGVIYDRYKTRLLLYLGGLFTFMPFFSTLYFFFILSNFGFPGTINFVGEFLIIVGGFVANGTFMVFVSFSLIFSLVYSLFFFTRVFFGSFSVFFRFYSDNTRLEFFVLFPLFFFICFFWIFSLYFVRF